MCYGVDYHDLLSGKFTPPEAMPKPLLVSCIASQPIITSTLSLVSC